MSNVAALLSDQAIRAARPPKHPVDPERPYAFLVEPEHSAAGTVVDVATLFLTNRECPYRCLMCDLWKHTTDEPVVPGAIPRQIAYALARLPPAQQIKLYNSGNFFDAKAIPRIDHAAIADQVRTFDRVIVENHPQLCTPVCVEFRDRIGTAQLEIALGLETVHPGILPTLNKRMTLADFARAVEFLRNEQIQVRAFILLKPPGLAEEEGVEWAVRSMEYAFSLGVGCCSVIPTRAGNGIMEQLQQQGYFAPPLLRSAERVLEAGFRLGCGRVFLDLWELEKIAPCDACREPRRARLQQMNLTQTWLPPVPCGCEETTP